MLVRSFGNRNKNEAFTHLASEQVLKSHFLSRVKNLWHSNLEAVGLLSGSPWKHSFKKCDDWLFRMTSFGTGGANRSAPSCYKYIEEISIFLFPQEREGKVQAKYNLLWTSPGWLLQNPKVVDQRTFPILHSRDWTKEAKIGEQCFSICTHG
jgi:hypothetical protein